MKTYSRWLKAKLAYLDTLAGQELDGPDFDDIDALVREAGRRAAEAGLPEVVYLSRLPAGGLAPERAREYLAECLAALDAKTADATSELLTLEQAAKHLGYSPSGLRKMAKRGDVRYVQSKPSAPLKFRREWLDEFGKAKETAKPQPVPKKSVHGLNANLLG